MKSRISKLFVLLMVALVSLQTSVLADQRIYQVDSTQSNLTVSATVVIFPLTEQFTGSLSSTMGGTVWADVLPTTIKFLNASLVPTSNRLFLPGANGVGAAAYGNFGGNLNMGPYGQGTAAFRGLVYKLVSAAIGRTTGTTSLFAVNTVTVGTTSGVMDLALGLMGSGREQFAPREAVNASLQAGSLSATACIETIRIPIDAQYVYPAPLNAVIRFTGIIVAIRNLCGRNP